MTIRALDDIIDAALRRGPQSLVNLVEDANGDCSTHDVHAAITGWVRVGWATFRTESGEKVYSISDARKALSAPTEAE